MLFLQALVFAMSTAALSVTAPAQGSSISQSDNLVVTWSTVSTDSQSFNIELALSTDAGNQQTLEDNVSPSTLTYSTPASAFAPGNYTINLVGTTQQSSGILAQSKWFLITASSSSSSARASAATASTTRAAAGAGMTSAAASAAGSSATGSASGSAASVSPSPSSGSTTTTSSTSGAENICLAAGSILAGFAALLL